jgi:alkanesulfonate monooxygenase
MSYPLQVISSLTSHAPKDTLAGPHGLIDAAKHAEADGVDSLLIGYTASTPDGWTMASYALGHTSSIRILLAHRPGIMSPVLAARMAATLDVLSGGRLDLNVVAGGSASDQMREGDFVGHDERYARAIEYVGLLRRLWSETGPVDHEGHYYRIVKAFQVLKPATPGGPAIYMGGASEAATQFAVESADGYMSWSEPVELVRARFAEVRERCRAAGRERPRCSVSMRLILGDTEEEAWGRAEAMLPADVEQRRMRRAHSEDAGRNRQLALVRDSLVHDERLWMGLAAATGGQGSTGALVGTAEQVQRALLRYVVEAGADTLLLTGPDGAYLPFLSGFLADLRAAANDSLLGSPMS